MGTDLSSIIDSSFDTTSFIASPLPTPQKKMSMQKRRESSVLLKQKLKGKTDADDNQQSKQRRNQEQKHQIQSISQSILNAHRKHMSELMDILRGEMDLIASF